jgi:multiple sugar transport system substrate-binding protein
MKSKSIRIAISFALLAVILEASVFCSPTEITVWARSDESPFITPLIDGFNKSNPSLRATLTIVPAGAAFTQKFAAALATGSGPDVVSLNLVYVPYFASVGQLADITSMAAALPGFNTMNASEKRLATYDGKTYALPFTGDASVLFYNKDLFAKAGIKDPPKTWAELKEDAKKVTALGNDTYGFYFPGNGSGWNLFTFTPYVWAAGGDVLLGEGKDQKANLNSPQVIAALSLYRQMMDDGSIPSSSKSDDGSQILTLFEAQKIGMLGNGSFAYSELTTKYPNVHFGIAPIPGPNGGESSFAGGDTIAIPKGTKHLREAWSFLAWATSKETQWTYLAKAGIVPIRPDAIPASYSASNPSFAALVHAMSIGKTPKSVVYSQLFENPNGAWASMIHDSVFTPDTPSSVAAKAQAGFEEILAAQ